MDYPYDAGLDDDTKAFLAVLRAKRLMDEPNAELMSVIAEEMPPDLKAWLHTYATHAGVIRLYDIELSGDGMPLSELTEDFDADELAQVKHEGTDGLDLDSAIVMANTADGEVYYAAAWAAGAPRLTLVKYCMSGYEDDGFIALGSLVPALRKVCEDIEDISLIDAEIRALLVPDRLGELDS